jgi:peptidoglycan/xylan/chitin deacetylase (PgdA/CDA1 family)
VFRAHISAIRSVADIINEDELLAAIDNPDDLMAGDGRVALTFDDGYRQHLTEPALALIQDLKLRPTVFMVAAGVDSTLGPPRRLVRAQRSLHRPLADVDELRAAMDAGWFVGSHTSSHWNCGSGDAADLAREIAGSKKTLEANLGVEIRTFAFPYGKPENVTALAVTEVERSGYRAAFTTSRGLLPAESAARFSLPRDVVESWWGPGELRGCLSGILDRVRSSL